MLSLRINRQSANPLGDSSQRYSTFTSRFRRSVIRLWKRYPMIYLPLVILAAFPGLLFQLLFPLLLVLLPISLVKLVFGAGTGMEWGVFLFELSLLLFSGLAAYVLLQFRFQLPKGIELSRAEYPRLFELVDSLGELHKRARIDRVILRDDTDVQIIKTPKNGFPLSMTHTLAIGIQALISMPPVYFDLLVARRVGQLGSKDHRLVGWLAHLTGVWRQYADACGSSQAKGAPLICGYYRFYAPIYEACALGIQRQSELEADQYALEYINYDDAADGIIAHSLFSDFLRRKYWPMLRRSARKEIGEKLLPYTHMNRILDEKVTKLVREKLFQQAMEREDDYRNTLPTLSQRLENLEYATPSACSQTLGSAAKQYLEGQHRKILEQFDRKWMKKQGISQPSK